MNDFGLKVGVDGEADFRKALSNINSSLKTVGTEAKLVASQYDSTDKSTEALAARTEVLNKQIEAQKSKVELCKDALAQANAEYGEGSKQSQKYQQELNLAQAELNNLTKATNGASDATEDMANTTEKSSDKIKNAAKAIGTGVAAIGTAVVAATAQLVKFTTETAATADDLITTSQITGIATDKLQELAYSADLVDTSVETITSSMRKNIKAMSEARDGSARYAEVYETLGVSVTNADGNLRDSEEVYWEIIDALGSITNETERDALAMQILGKSAQDLNPLIEAGSQRMKELATEAHETGYVMSEETLSRFGALQDEIDTLTNRGQSLAISFGSVLLPALTSLGDIANDSLGKIAESLKEGDIDGVISAINELVPQLTDTITNVIGKVAKAVLNNLPTILQTIIDIIFSIVDTISQNMNAIVNTIVILVSKIVTMLIDNLPRLIETIVALIVALVDAILDNLPLIIETITDAIPMIVDALIESTPTLIKGIVLIVASIVKNLPAIFVSILASVGTLLTDIFNRVIAFGQDFEEGGKIIMESLWEGIKKVFAKIGEWFSGAFNGIKNFISGIFGKDTADELANIIPSEVDMGINANVMTNTTTTANSEAMAEQNELLRALLNKEQDIYIGDEALATSVNRYNSNAGFVMVGGGY